MKKVVLTGATGFIGANLARRLLTDGHEVSMFLRPNHSPWRIQDILGDVQVCDADLRDDARVTAAVRRARPDWLFNLAAHGAYSWQTDPRAMMMTNVVGTANLLNAAVSTGFESFVQTGTSSEYGAKDHAPSETEWLEPNSHYAVTKASATLLCRYTGQSTGLGVRTLRLYSVFGPWEEPSRLLPTLVEHGLRGQLPNLVRPETARDYVYVDDVIDALLAAATTPAQEPGAVYNVGTGVQTTLRDLVELVRAEMGISVEPVWGTMAPRIWDTDHWIADNAAMRVELGWQPRHSLLQGVRLLRGWLEDHREVQEQYGSVSRA